jgi:hypothetical protein
MKMEQSVPKRRHIKFSRRGINRRKHTTYRTRQKFEIKKEPNYSHWLRNSGPTNARVWHHGPFLIIYRRGAQADKSCNYRTGLDRVVH